jgi:hypothetical protein
MNQENQQNQEEQNIGLVYHTKALETRGFPAELIAELEARLEAARTQGLPSFSIPYQEQRDDEWLVAELQYRKHDVHDIYYFNGFDVQRIKDGEVLAALFVKASYKITLEEANSFLLYGDKVAVYKENIKKDQNRKGQDEQGPAQSAGNATTYNAFISVVDDEQGGKRLNTYHDNYYIKREFDIDLALQGLVGKAKEITAESLAEIKDAILHANPYPVSYEKAGQSKTAYLTMNAAEAKINVLNEYMETIELTPRQEKAQELQASQKTGAEVKKKPTLNQPQTIRQRPRGMSPR